MKEAKAYMHFILTCDLSSRDDLGIEKQPSLYAQLESRYFQFIPLMLRYSSQKRKFL